jgi:subtilisin family serine protease
MKACWAVGVLLATVFFAPAHPAVMYRLTLTDKGHPPYSIERSQEFLSEKSIERRAKQGISPDSTDLPIDPAYFQALTEAGATVRASSKWVGTITVSFSDTALTKRIAELPFVQAMTPVWSGDFDPYEPMAVDSTVIHSFAPPSPGQDYGNALAQIRLNNLLPLHEKGYKGKGMTIAVIDGGFHNADRYPDILNPRNIQGTRNFTHQTGEPCRNPETHGTLVLSCMLANAPGTMIGTAPEAHFYLLQSELGREEYLVEEDYWVAALEYADSLGVDIVSSSLGYSHFNDTTMNHRWAELDGCTAPASRAASMAAGKGMALFHSAGNEGLHPWQKTAIPADARNILTVGAVKKDSTCAAFSSWGILADGRIKPDVMAMGEDICAFHPETGIIATEGTSFATPMLAGAAACLWSACPSLSATELITLIREHADRFDRPDPHYGYGIPNIGAAYLKTVSQWNF